MTNMMNRASGTYLRWSLDFDREAVAEMVRSGELDLADDITAAVEGTGDGLGVVREAVEAASRHSSWTWRGSDSDPALTVSADFTCDAEGFLVNDSNLLLSVLLPTGACISDTGLRRMRELPWSGFETVHDVLDGVTALLNDCIDRATLALLSPPALRPGKPGCPFHEGEERNATACTCAEPTLVAGELS